MLFLKMEINVSPVIIRAKTRVPGEQQGPQMRSIHIPPALFCRPAGPPLSSHHHSPQTSTRSWNAPYLFPAWPFAGVCLCFEGSQPSQPSFLFMLLKKERDPIVCDKMDDPGGDHAMKAGSRETNTP